jgi:butyrate kinase
MFQIEETFDAEMLAANKSRPTVVFVEPLDPRILEAVCHLTRFIKPVLLASEADIRSAVSQSLGHVDPTRIEFALSESAFVDIRQRKDLTDEFSKQARAPVSEPGAFGIYAAALGHADMVVGGAQYNPRQFFRPMLSLLARRPVTSEAGVFVLPDTPKDYYPRNIVVFGDVAVNATMTPRRLAEVAVQTCVVTRDLIPESELPEIHAAIVSYSHKGSDEGPSPEMIRNAMELVPELLAEQTRANPRYGSIRIEGEVKISAAISHRSAEFYGETGLAGDTNVIICPNLETGNLLYYLYSSSFPKAKKFTVVCGIGSRGVDLARDCRPEDVRLGVKAALVRMVRDGAWKATPRDTFFRRYRVLALNPGSTSTKVAVYEGDLETFRKELQHSPEELAPFAGKSIAEQYAMRREAVLRSLKEQGIDPAGFDAVCGRGGVLQPIPHGTYKVGEAMLQELRSGGRVEHASNLGAIIAHELASAAGKPAFIVDPIVVDEAPTRSKITGIKSIRRRVITHALSQISSAHRYAHEKETFYENLNIIVCHLGGGISVGAHCQGRYVDANDALDGEGPFSPERCGSLPQGQFAEFCFSGQHTFAEVKKLIKGAGGLIDLLGTSDLREVERRVLAGDPEASEVFDALAYQVAKGAASLLPAFEGKPLDRVILTGGMARSRPLVELLTKYLSGLGCGITVYPGENEMIALAKGALRVLYGREKARDYPPA